MESGWLQLRRNSTLIPNRAAAAPTPPNFIRFLAPCLAFPAILPSAACGRRRRASRGVGVIGHGWFVLDALALYSWRLGATNEPQGPKGLPRVVVAGAVAVLRAQRIVETAGDRKESSAPTRRAEAARARRGKRRRGSRRWRSHSPAVHHIRQPSTAQARMPAPSDFSTGSKSFWRSHCRLRAEHIVNGGISTAGGIRMVAGRAMVEATAQARFPPRFGPHVLRKFGHGPEQASITARKLRNSSANRKITIVSGEPSGKATANVDAR